MCEMVFLVGSVLALIGAGTGYRMAQRRDASLVVGILAGLLSGLLLTEVVFIAGLDGVIIDFLASKKSRGTAGMMSSTNAPSASALASPVAAKAAPLSDVSTSSLSNMLSLVQRTKDMRKVSYAVNKQLEDAVNQR